MKEMDIKIWKKHPVLSVALLITDCASRNKNYLINLIYIAH